MTMMNLLGTGKDKVWKVRRSPISDGWERQVKQYTWADPAQNKLRQNTWACLLNQAKQLS